jgi:putative transposase
MVCNETNEDQSKKKELRYKERDREERIKYYRLLRELIKKYGIESLVYIDECGFEQTKVCLYGWAVRGKKIYGEKQGKRSRKENLVAGRRKRKKDLIAPMIFTGSLDAGGFEGWLSLYFLPALKSVSVLIMDNAPIHRKARIKELVEAAGHEVVFLPRYSPDLNDIEHDFSALKRARMYADADTSLDDIVRAYCRE